MAKKYLIGFANLGYRPVTKNDSDGYTVDDDKYTAIPGAQSCSPNDNRTDYTIPADDGIWDSGSEWNYTDLDITVAESELKVMAALVGADYNEETFVEDEGTFDDAPEVALSFSALRSDRGYRLYRYWAARCTGYSVTHNTKGQNTDAQAYTFHFRCTPRKDNGKIRATKDIAKGEALTWIKSFATQSGS